MACKARGEEGLTLVDTLAREGDMTRAASPDGCQLRHWTSSAVWREGDGAPPGAHLHAAAMLLGLRMDPPMTVPVKSVSHLRSGSNVHILLGITVSSSAAITSSPTLSSQPSKQRLNCLPSYPSPAMDPHPANPPHTEATRTPYISPERSSGGAPLCGLQGDSWPLADEGLKRGSQGGRGDGQVVH